MKKIAMYFVLCACVALALAQQPTPNIGLQIPATGSNNWYIPLNFNFSKLDQLLSGNVAIPALKITNNLNVGGTITANAFSTGAGSNFASAIPSLQFAPVFYSGTGSSSTFNGVNPFTGLLWYRSGAVPLPASSLNVGSLFSGCSSGVPALRFDGTCYAPSGSGAAFPGLNNQQVFSAGAGAGAASLATLDAAGHSMVASNGGTPDANIITSSTPTSNDAISRSLQTTGNFATVNQAYPVTELVSSALNMRQPIFVSGYLFGAPTPNIAYDTGFSDRRPLSFGDVFYNPHNSAFPPMVHNSFLKDDDELGSNHLATNYNPFVNGFLHTCCGVVQSGNDQSNIQMVTSTYIDASQGIAGFTDQEFVHNGIGDGHNDSTLTRCNGNTQNFSDEGCWAHRDDTREDAQPFFGTVATALAKGTTVIPITPGSSSKGPGEGRYAINVTQQNPTQFHILSVDAPHYPDPAVYHTDRTFVPDTFCQIVNTNTPQGGTLSKGGTTPTSINLGNCTAAIVVNEPVCIGTLSTIGVQSAMVTFAGALVGTAQTITANLEGPISTTASEIFMQGPNACKFVELLANQTGSGTAQPYRSVVRVLGNNPFRANNTLDFVSAGAGNWGTGPGGDFGTQLLASGIALTRDGSGNVCTNIGSSDFSHAFPGTVIRVNSATDTTYNGTFTIATQVNPNMCWSNPGTAGSTTTTGNTWFVAVNGFDNGAALIGPGVEIMQANNPTTRVVDGTIVADANNMTIAANDVISSSSGNNNVIGTHHEAVEYVGSPSQSLGAGLSREAEFVNPPDGFVIDDIAVTGNHRRYSGGGGFRKGIFMLNTNHGDPLFQGYESFSAPLTGGFLRQVSGCGLKPCTDSGAFYTIDQFQGATASYKSQWNAFSNNLHTTLVAPSQGTSSFDMTPNQIQLSTNDGAGNTNFVTMQPTLTLFSKPLIAPSVTVSTTGGASVTTATNNTGASQTLTGGATTGTASLGFSTVGSNVFGFGGWGIGNGAGLPGVVGLFDSTTNTFPWNTNSSDDMCFGVTIGGGNVAGCTGATAKITHTGDATFNSVSAVNGFTGTKTAGACVFTITSGIITNVTGC